MSFCDCPGLLHQSHGAEQAPEASGYLMRPRRFMGPDSFSLPTHRLHSFRDANCKSYLQRVFFAQMKRQRSNSIIACKHLAEDLVYCPGGALQGEGAGEGACTPSALAAMQRCTGSCTHLVGPWALLGDWKLSKGIREVGRQGHLVEIEVAN